MIRAAPLPADLRLAGADRAAVGLELEGSSPAARDEIGLRALSFRATAP